MTNLSTKSCLIYDKKTFVTFAECLGKEFGKVMYYSQWKDSFPQLKYNLIGTGFENFERVDNFFDYVPEADIICFPDCLDGDLQIHLEEMGKKVWGSRNGDQMELNRVGMKDLLKDLGLPVIPYEPVTGMDNLRKYLKEHKDIWVKLSTYRGTRETFKSPNYDYISLELDKLQKKLGAWKDKQEFICEENTPDCTEFGYDGYNIDGIFPAKTMFGPEVKDLGYVCKMTSYEDIPEPVLEFNNAITPYLKKWGYKNNFSTEVRIDKKGKGYMTDPCCRMPSPPGDLMMKMFTNYPQIVWEGAHGNCIDPIPENKFGVEITIKSTDAEEGQLPVQFPKKYKDNVRLTSCMKLDGNYYVIPSEISTPYIGAIVTTGDTLEEACEQAEEIGNSVRASYIEIPFDCLKKAQNELDRLKEFGFDIFK